MSEKIDYSKGIYDARQLGAGRMFILGVQHMFAMFGATVLVPLLTGLSVSTTLLCAGLGTLLFHLITKKKVPAFLGSSFAYLGGFSIVAPMLADADGNLTVANTKMLPYACAAVAFSGLVYLVASLLISTFGIRRIMRFFPPVVTGPIIISIGLILAPSAIKNCQSNWILAFVALGVVIVCNIWGKGMVKILPILIGVLVSYAVALVTGAVDFQRISEAAWVGIPLHREAMGLFAIDGSPEFISARVHHHPHCTGNHDGACGRYRRHQRNRGPQLYQRPRPEPAPCWATVWQPPWPACWAARPIPPTARTPVCWL